jgi:hypothetical protein
MFALFLQGLVVFLCRIVIAAVLLSVVFVALFSLPTPPAAPCSEAWAESIERNYVSASDVSRHGPKRGDGEWFHFVETGLRMDPLQSNDREANCVAVAREICDHHYIRSRLFGKLIRLD